MSIKTEIKTDGPKIDPELEKPLLEVSVTNPFKKIMYWLDQIRRKQTTTFMIKLSIPLIAMPVIAVVFFQIGRGVWLFSDKVTPLPQTGIDSPTVTQAPTQDLQVSRSGTLRVAKGQQTKYLLALKDGSILLLDLPANLNLDKYVNKQILATGTYKRSTNILKVEDVAEIENLEPIPTLTPAPTLTSTPTPTSVSNTPTPTP